MCASAAAAGRWNMVKLGEVGEAYKDLQVIKTAETSIFYSFPAGSSFYWGKCSET